MNDLHQYLRLPEQVHKGDFVVKLTEGIAHPAELLPDYAITPGIVECFDKALDLVGAAIRGKQNYGAYVHGSFGSGKSHFLAVLSLMLGNDPAPWDRAELHPLRVKYGWTSDAKVLRLHFHMVGARSIEQKIFGEYLRRVREDHPQAELPALFEDEQLFADAAGMRAQLGDAKFFAPMNAGSSGAGWGDLAAASRWDAASFEAARRSSDPDERARLFSALAKSWFLAFAQGSAGYIDFDRGLDVLSKHAAGLGYRAVVFFLDELILWLAARAGEMAWLNAETGKLAKLVERQSIGGGAPLVSFVARQRDIAELVGTQHAGAQSQALHDTLKFWDGRFDVIKLEDRNLPAIVEKRVVRAKDEAARKRLDEAFAVMRGSLGQVAWETLLGKDADEKAFRQVYPFSPSLIDALVALSQTLQRERTALKVLMEMLVDHLRDFELGKVVPVGDLYDALAGGDEPMDGQMRERFKLARRLYQGELLPAIRNLNDTGTREVCQRLRDEHPVAIGCSNCAQVRCRDDNRLVKTLLLAALVPQAPTLANLTASKLVQLNWGTLKTPVPGAQLQMGVARLRGLAAQVGKLTVGEGSDPIVGIRLEGVDLKPIVESARVFDNSGSRRRKLQEILFGALGLPSGETTFSHSVTWRNTSRSGTIQFANVRELPPSSLEAAYEEDFKIVIDYPFDEPGRTPGEDEVAVQAFVETGRTSATLAWLPSFLSERVLRELGELVVIDELITGDTLKTYVQGLRGDDQVLARNELLSLSNQKKQLVRRALEVAYGLKADDGDVDASRTLEKHFHILLGGASDKLGGLAAVTFESAVREAVDELLQRRYPRHPTFADKVTAGKLAKALEHYQRLCESDSQRLTLDKAQLKEVDIPEKLGLVSLGEASASVRPGAFQEIDNKLRARGIEAPTVAQLRDELNPPMRGLSDDVVDFLVRAYAIQGRRELVRGGQPIGAGRLPNDAELVLPRMPSAAAWESALGVANSVFGVTMGARALHAVNLRAFALLLSTRREEAAKEGAGEIVSLLVRWRSLSRDPAPRAETAQAVAQLLSALDVRDAVAQVEALASLMPRTSLQAMGKHVLAARKTADALRDELTLISLEGLRASRDPLAIGILEELARVLSADQLNEDLAPRLKELALRAQRLKKFDPVPGPGIEELTGEGLGALEERIAQLRKDTPAGLAWSLRITRKG